MGKKSIFRLPEPQDLLVRSSATLSLVPVVSAASGFTSGSPIVPDMASAAAFLSRSASSVLTSFPPTRSLDSFSSSLSPRLKGSLSASPTGLGSTEDNGCHLLDLPGVGAFSPALGLGESRLISSGGPPWNDTFRPSADFGVAGVGLKRSGLASGRVERRGAPAHVSDIAYIQGGCYLPSSSLLI